MPGRIQLSRAKGAKLPFRAVKVDRSTRWGNPYRVGEAIDMKQARRWGWNISPEGRRVVCKTAEEAVARFRHALFWDTEIHDFVRNELGGRDLACWCEPGRPCHADVLIEIARTDAQDIRQAQADVDAKIFAEADAIAAQH